MKLLTKTGMEVVASVDPDFSYFRRSFCLLELLGGCAKPTTAVREQLEVPELKWNRYSCFWHILRGWLKGVRCREAFLATS